MSIDGVSLYDEALSGFDGITPLKTESFVNHARHLYVVRINAKKSGIGRDEVFSYIRSQGIGVNVHYIPVYLHPFYRSKYGTSYGQCPSAESAYSELLSLPMFPAMEDADVDRVVHALEQAKFGEKLI